MQRFLGIANYSRVYIPHFAEVTRPLYAMTKCGDLPQSMRKKSGVPNGKKVILTWTEEGEKAFNKLKEIMASDLVLALPDFDHEFIVNTDASDHGYGAFLEQKINDNQRIIAYYSKS